MVIALTVNRMDGIAINLADLANQNYHIFILVRCTVRNINVVLHCGESCEILPV